MLDLRKIPKEISDNRNLYITHNFVNGSTSVHMHEFFEIEFVISGKAKQMYNGITYNVESGSLYFISPVDFHGIYDVEEDLTIVNIIFDNSFYGIDALTELVNKNGNIITCLSGEEKDEIESIISLLAKRWISNDEYTDAGIKNMLECLLLFILKHAKSSKTENLSENIKPIQAAMQYMLIHYRENPSLEEVSQKCGYSKSHFCRQFKSITGKTYTEFLNSLKVNYAKILLLTSEKTIIEITDICGFSSVSNFNKAFKKETQISPTQFLKKIKK